MLPPVSSKAGLKRIYLIHLAVLLSGAERLHPFVCPRRLQDGLGRLVNSEAPDEPGALAKVAEKFKQAGVNIQSLHIIERKAGHPIVALSADDPGKSRGVGGSGDCRVAGPAGLGGRSGAQCEG